MSHDQTLPTVLTEICHNDHTAVYEYYSAQYACNNTFTALSVNLDNLETIEAGKYFYSSPFLSFGDYDNSCAVERANVREFIKVTR